MNQPTTGDVAYRYEGYVCSLGVDEFDNPIPGGRVVVSLRKFSVERVTPKGFWITGPMTYWRRFVLREARKRFACLTQREAAESFVARKQRQISILQARLRQAEQELHLIRMEIVKMDRSEGRQTPTHQHEEHPL